MRNLTTHAVILMSVLAICISGIAIAFISHDECPMRAGPHRMMMHRPPPMQGQFEGGARQRAGGLQRGNRGERRKNSSQPQRRPQ